MKARHERELALRYALKKLYPNMPDADALTAAQRHQSRANPEDKHDIYVAACGVARHNYTDYDKLCPPGAHDATKQNARAATRPAVRAKLREWGGPERDPG